MQILEMNHVETCLDGTVVKEVILTKEINTEFIQNLKDKGRLQYFPHFARPFFKLTIDGKLTLKGIEGNTSIRIRVETPVEEHLRLFIQLIK